MGVIDYNAENVNMKGWDNLKKYIATMILGIIGFIVSRALLEYALSWWSSPSYWAEFTVHYLLLIYWIVLGIWIFKQKGKRLKHMGMFILIFSLSWILYVSILLRYDSYQSYKLENYPTVVTIRNKEDMSIHHLNMDNVQYRSSDNAVHISFKPNNAYTVEDVHLIIDWLPSSENNYSVYIDDISKIDQLFRGSTYLRLTPDKKVARCKSDLDYQHICNSLNVKNEF